MRYARHALPAPGLQLAPTVRARQEWFGFNTGISRNGLEGAPAGMRDGALADFRMVIRGGRVLHGDATSLGGRAREVAEGGFYIKTQKAGGHLPGNIWRLAPESRHRADSHCAVYPEGLMPVRATCPPSGVVLDPFSGTGTSVITAPKHGRRAVGIDISPEYCETARNRIERHLQQAGPPERQRDGKTPSGTARGKTTTL